MNANNCVEQTIAELTSVDTVCTCCSIQKMPRLLLASQDGYLYIYNLDPAEGGECTLLKQHR